MELVIFAMMAVLSYLALVTRRNTAIYAWIATFALYTLIVRLKPPTSDIVNYLRAMNAWPPPFLFYTLREPLFWIGAPLLRKLIGHDVLALLTLDAVVMAIVFRSTQASDGDEQLRPLTPTMMTSYVFLLGQQNILRQHLAFVLLLLATLPHYRKRLYPSILLIASFLSHNATIVLFGYWFDVNDRQRRHIGPVITAIGAVSLFFLLSTVGKSSADTGMDTRLFYVTLAVVILTLFIFSNHGRRFHHHCPALMNFIAFLPATLVISSASFERIAMMFVFFMVIDIYRNHKHLRMTKLVAAQIAYGVLVIPVFLFPSTLRFLLL